MSYATLHCVDEKKKKHRAAICKFGLGTTFFKYYFCLVRVQDTKMGNLDVALSIPCLIYFVSILVLLNY